MLALFPESGFHFLAPDAVGMIPTTNEPSLGPGPGPPTYEYLSGTFTECGLDRRKPTLAALIDIYKPELQSLEITGNKTGKERRVKVIPNDVRSITNAGNSRVGYLLSRREDD